MLLYIFLTFIILYVLYFDFRPFKYINKKENKLESTGLNFPENINKYKVIVHIHTEFSFDSLGKPSDIKKAMEVNGIDYVFVTDHNNMDYKYFEDDKIFAGIEKNTDDGRLLLLGGELPVISHPNNFEFEHYKWKGEFKKDYLYELIIPKDAIVWNKALTLATLFKNLILFPFIRTLVRKWTSLIPYDKWLDLYFTRARGENIIGGLDLHIKLVLQERTHGILIPSYKSGFKWVCNQVYSRKELKTKGDVLNALKNGNLFISLNWNFGDFFGEKNGEYFIPGENIEEGTNLVCKFNRKKTLKILKYENKPVIITHEHNFQYKVKDKGFYHFEVFEYDFKIGNLYFGFRPVIITNFFKVGEE